MSEVRWKAQACEFCVPASADFCGEEDSIYCCTRAAGHSGPHISCDPSHEGHDIHRWNDSTTWPEEAVRQEGAAHYRQMDIQPWDVIDEWPLEQQVGYHRGNVLKYAMRMGSKDERLTEAKKLRHYADKLVQVLEQLE